MARTRATKASNSESQESSQATSGTKYTLSPPTENIPKVFVLPTKASPEARIVTLPHPRQQRPTRYLVCPTTGIHEFTQISAPKSTPRSWFVETGNGRSEAKKKDDVAELQAQVTKGADLFIASPFDPLFLVLPVLAESNVSKGSDEKKRMFLASDDHFDKLPEESSHLSEILRWPDTRALIERRMEAICDTVDVGDELMFRLNEAKLFQVILQKARKMGTGGLPPSMEEKFVIKALEAPILIQKRDMGVKEKTNSAESEVSTPRTDSNDSQSTATTVDTTASAESQASTAATSFTEEDAPESADMTRAMEATTGVVELQRLRIAFNYICAAYITTPLTRQLQESLANKEISAVDFKPLDEYCSKLAQVRSDAMAARSMGDYSRKRGRDDEEDEATEEKKRKLEEEKKRKANESRGVRELKKVNTSGMKKMSDFFKKK